MTASPPDDLDAFFAAAAGKDTGALHEAAKTVIIPALDKSVTEAKSASDPDIKKSTASGVKKADLPKVKTASSGGFPHKKASKTSSWQREADKMLVTVAEGDNAEYPFVLVPAGLHKLIPVWGWLLLGFSLLGVFLAILIAPRIHLGRTLGMLGEDSQSSAHLAMRDLITRGDDAAIDRLYRLAVSRAEPLRVRMRAIDSLGLIGSVPAENALLRLEMNMNNEETIRKAAALARNQIRNVNR